MKRKIINAIVELKNKNTIVDSHTIFDKLESSHPKLKIGDLQDRLELMIEAGELKVKSNGLIDFVTDFK